MQKNCIVVFGIFFLFTKLTAQTDTIKLNEIEVNANRVQNSYKDQMRIVQIITQEDLQHLPSISLTEILDYAGNVDVRQRGIHNIQADISIRGGNYEQTLIMLDGIPINDPQTGHHNMDIPIDLHLVERIEILSGGDARQYGANAFSGVINIVTKKPNKNNLSAKLIGGDFKYFSGNLSGTLQLLNTFSQISIGHHQSNGYRTNTDFDHSQISWKIHRKGEKNNTHALLAIENKAFGAMAFYTPKFPFQYEQTKTLLSALTNKLHFNKNTWTTQLYYRQHHDRFELFRHDMPDLHIPAWYKNHNYHMTRVAGGQSNIAFISSIGKTTIGTDLRYEQIFSNVLGEPLNDTIPAPFEKKGFFTKKADKILESVYIDHYMTIKKFQWSAGLMTTLINHKNIFVYPGIELGYQINHHWKIFASGNQSVRLPTYTELYYKDPVHQGNSMLKPEQANQIETGVKFQQQQIQAQLACYYRKGKNIIDWVRISETDKWRSENITQVNTIGIESNITYIPENKHIAQKIIINYAYNSITKQTGQYYSKYALDVLRNKVSLTTIHRIYKDFTFSWTLLYHERIGTYTEFPTGIEKKYKPYMTLDAQISYAYKKTKLFIQGSNLLNTQYYDIANIPMPGRWVKGGFTFDLY